MKKDILNRRNFNQLAAATLGGVVAATALAGCSNGTDPTADGGDGGAVAQGDIHLCRGLNSCKGKGATGENACAGQGQCASVKAHSCGGQNECKGQGGCGDEVGTNDCKGKGGCAIPLMEGKWKEARAALEDRMKKAGKEIGEAPAAK